MSGSILLFGATSMLGYHLATVFPRTVRPFISPGNRSPSVRRWPALKLDDPTWIEGIFQKAQPDVLMYCHAVCDVSKCQSDPDWAYAINVRQVERVMTVLPDRTRLVYVSSDHVFGGDGRYDEASSPCPISVYGRTRVAAERQVLSRPGSLVIRTGLGVGDSPDGRTGHRDWLRYRTLRQLPITIIHDEYRSAVWIRDLARRVRALASSRETGIRHLSATRAVSRVELADHLMQRMGLVPNFNIESRHQQPTPHIGRVELTSRYGGILSSPLGSVLDCEPAV
ncbi:MAG: sugar nucleotide-binding protein [Nitrospirales bacterium]|nr:sugar nucleotide-binding protein [Nitrospira sp.]MDR4502152.1 sugar nucleotide-binding protein [Nitrospirales bacterium]